MKLEGRTAMVTGGAVRVGRAISVALAGRGARVVVHYNSSSDEADALVAEIVAAGGEAMAIGADLSSLDEVERLVQEAGEFGPISLLVNSASVFPAEGFVAVDGEIWDQAMNVNLRAPFFLTQAIAGRMKQTGEGVVVNIADLSAIQTWSGYAAHGIAKAGLLQMTRIAARAFAPEVRSAAIVPGTVLPPEDLPQAEIDDLARRAPLKRIGTPEDVARAVLFLAENDFITGEVLVVDGGRALA